MIREQVTIQNDQGFHVRPAQLFVTESNKFSSTIKLITENDNTVDGKSILGLMTLGLAQGSTVTITAEGADEEAAVRALVELVNSKFGEA
ncbi:HPr family phosphocarrier protein [Tumebacillus permanentifrigoris]|uniref:Phosphocarrier protein HPr n=1 Tax=Tumebacillus permanentifrigoris TaxID=378543 RepID=A0A316D3X9_9BACL|nr:HPr family phosphocarrier protein [Tumebacillus permanentifrigoris]PWK06652.1 phosphocarrier protein HPr/phosphocarrier protein [Tumebacillus permanentifrigoris]